MNEENATIPICSRYLNVTIEYQEPAPLLRTSSMEYGVPNYVRTITPHFTSTLSISRCNQCKFQNPAVYSRLGPGK